MTLSRKGTDTRICDVVELRTLAEKSKGLLGEETPHGVYLRTRWGIHTFGLRFPIDVVVADDDLRIRAIKKNLPPMRFFFWNQRFQNVFELPAGTIDAVRLEVGDILELRQ